jgi:hypothetical protein
MAVYNRGARVVQFEFMRGTQWNTDRFFIRTPSSNTGVGVLGLFLYPVTLPCSQRFYLREIAISFIAVCFSEIPLWRFCNLMLQYLAEFGPLRLLPQRSAVRNQNHRRAKLCRRDLFLDPVYRTQPTFPFDFGSLATT